MKNTPTLAEQLAKGMRALRLTRGWSQIDLAEHAGLHRTTIGLLERARGNITPDKLDALAQALGVDVPDLFKL
jgi:transcriptional regulator with XRE-family HTH domain